MTDEQKARRKARDKKFRETNPEYYKTWRKENRATQAIKRKKYRAENQDKITAQQKAWQANNVEKRREYHASHYRANKEKWDRHGLRQRYGLTLEDRNRMMQEQDYQCAGCEMSFWDCLPCVDHCHVSGLVRGILCADCNRALGGARDSIKTLHRLAAYLGRAQARVHEERE